MAVRGIRTKTRIPAITTTEIELAIARYYGTREHIIVPNISWGFDYMHECDMFIIKKNGYAVEVEIKRSKSDLINDFKKPHHHKSNRIREFFYAIPKKNLEEWGKLIPKHAGIIVYWKTKDEIWDKKKRRWSGEFKWVTRAGRIRNAEINKTARKLTTEEQLKVARLGCLRIWNLKQKLIKDEANN
jgi:hypothetical protein